MTDGAVMVPPPLVLSHAQPLTECKLSGVSATLDGGALPSGGTGGSTSAGPGRLTSCAEGTRIECFGDGKGVGAAVTPLDCVPDAGLAGKPARSHGQCEAALDGESGDGCLATFTCGRRVGETCCVQVAHCQAGSPLRRYGVCPSACVVPSFVTEGFIDSCEQLAELWEIDPRAGAWLGTPCLGDFVCPGAPPQVLPAAIPAIYADFYYCAGGGLQMVPMFILGG